MNGVDLAWMAIASASLTLGLIHLCIWARQRDRIDIGVFFVLASAAAGFGAFELQMMRATTPGEWAAAARASHVPLAIFVVSTAISPGRRGGQRIAWRVAGSGIAATGLLLLGWSMR